MHERSHIDEINLVLVIDESWAELVAFPSGQLIRRYTNTTQEGIARSFISDDGGTAWVYRAMTDFSSECPVLPVLLPCVVSSHAIAIVNIGASVFDAGPYGVTAMNSFGNGRFLVFDKFNTHFNNSGMRGPVQILDWLTHHVETLSDAVTYVENDPAICNLNGRSAPCTVDARSANAQMSNDLRLVATTTSTDKGWYEYTTSP